MRIVRPAAFFHRLGADSKIGFGESYMVGDWTTDRPARPAHAVRGEAVHADPAGAAAAGPPLRRGPPAARGGEHRRGVAGEHPPPLRPVQRAVRAVPRRDDDLLVGLVRRRHRRPRPTPSAARSTASWTWPASAPAQHVLEIGTGWGGLATRAAQRGARVTTLTISAEQATLAEQRLAAAGVADRVQVLLRDYREAQGSYDAVGQRRDDRGGRRGVLADVLRRAGPAAQAGRPGRAAVDHHAARPDAGVARATTPGSTSTSSPAG